MNKIGVNDPCPCNSGKKYKKCYLSESKSCLIYRKERRKKDIEEHEKNEKYVTDCLLQVTEELKSLFYKTNEGDEIIPVLMQMMGIFTVIEVLGSYWYEYQNKTGKPTERFIEFVSTFCFDEINKEYKQRKYLKNMTAEELCKLRNSIIHFYGLGKNNKLCIIPNIARKSPQEKIDQTINNFLKIRKDFIFIQPFELKSIVIQGAISMLEKFKEDLKSIKDEVDEANYISNIKRIQVKLFNEGASRVSREMAERLNNKLSQ